MKNNFGMLLAYRVLALLDERKARLNADTKAFYVWMRAKRAVVVFDPAQIDPRKVNEQFAHDLSTRLQGRPVVRTNTRGLFLQVGYDIPPMLTDLSVVNLDLNKQPSPFDMPVGMTERGETWINLLDGDSFLIAGTRGMGKTGFLHGWIQSLLRGGKTLVYAHDGKRGVEFARYIGHDNFKVIGNLADTLRKLLDETGARRKVLTASGFPNVKAYNSENERQIMPIALIIDEAALTSDEEKASLAQIVERERDTGIHPILGTNRPEASALLVKTNLATRICFAVPSWHASQMALGMNGAEKLPKIQGRGLMVSGARVSEFQSFFVEYPKPSADALEQIEQLTLFADTTERLSPELAERARALHESGMGVTGIVAELFGNAGGAAWYPRARMVREAIGN